MTKTIIRNSSDIELYIQCGGAFKVMDNIRESKKYRFLYDLLLVDAINPDGTQTILRDVPEEILNSIMTH